MKYRSFGSTNLKVSEIGFGGWGIGGNKGNSSAYGPTNDDDSVEALNEACERGINFYDTSPLYGLGHSEQLIGKSFKDKRKKLIYATKVGYTNYRGDQDFSAEFIENSLNQSLKRLKTDYVDILQMHDIPLSIIKDSNDLIETLNLLKKKGKCRYFGVSNKTQEDSKYVVNEKLFESIQLNFNLIDQRVINNDLFNDFKKNNIAIICKTPLCFGFLTGKYNLKTMFHSDDHRSRWSKEQIKLWSNSLNFFLTNLKDFDDQSSAQFALRFCLSFNEISTIIPGMLNKKQVIENTKSSDFEHYSKEVLNNLRNIYNNNNFFVKN